MLGWALRGEEREAVLGRVVVLCVGAVSRATRRVSGAEDARVRAADQHGEDVPDEDVGADVGLGFRSAQREPRLPAEEGVRGDDLRSDDDMSEKRRKK